MCVYLKFRPFGVSWLHGKVGVALKRSKPGGGALTAVVVRLVLELKSDYCEGYHVARHSVFHMHGNVDPYSKRVAWKFESNDVHMTHGRL